MFDVPRWPQHPFADRPAQMVEAKHCDGPPPFETWEIFSWPRPAQFVLYYRPSLDDEQLIRSILPRADIDNPPWLAIRAVLVGEGYSVAELREWTILDVLAVLRQKTARIRADDSDKIELFPNGPEAVTSAECRDFARYVLAAGESKGLIALARDFIEERRESSPISIKPGTLTRYLREEIAKGNIYISWLSKKRQSARGS